MKYVSTAIPDSASVKGIYTVLRPDLSRPVLNAGESHDFPEIVYLDRGVHTIIIDGESYSLKSGQMIMYAPGAHHKTAAPSNSEASIISFEVEGDMLAPLYNRILTLTQSQKEIFRGIIDVAINCFRRREPGANVGGMILKDGVDEYTLQRIKKQLEFFLIDIRKNCSYDLPKSAKAVRWSAEFEAALDFLTEHISENLTLAEIADGCSMSVSKLKMLFREKCSGGPINYLNRLKMEKAKEMIREGKLNFTEIADRLGFASLHYFSRLFKKITGLSPTEYSGGV